MPCWIRGLRHKLGHEVRLMPAKDVKAYVKRHKNDAADAEAICEAVRRPTMRFVQVKSAEQQSQLMQHRARDLLMCQRTQLINALRSHMAELGIIAPQGREEVKELLAIVTKDANTRRKLVARDPFASICCEASVRRSIFAKQKNPEAEANALGLYRDMCSGGLGGGELSRLVIERQAIG